MVIHKENQLPDWSSLLNEQTQDSYKIRYYVWNICIEIHLLSSFVYVEVLKKYPNYQRFSHNRKAQSTNDLKEWQTIGSLSMKDYTAESPIADTINPRMYQGKYVFFTFMF